MTTSRWGRYLKLRREQGFCGWKRCSKKSGDEFHCPVHARMWAAYMRRYRQEKRDAARNKAS